jgi:hypothetical protein
MHGDASFGDVMYAKVSEDKPGRLRDYRTVASFSEVADALDEICDECINMDANKEIVRLHLINSDIKSQDEEEIRTEFNKFIDSFDLKNKGWRYFRQFLIEGELFFENIIHQDYTKQGILAVQNLPAENIDPVYGNIQNMLVKGFLYKKPIFSKNDPKNVDRYDYIPFEENQIIYINNEIYNETKDFVIPFVENCRRPYRQLSMIEDSVVIHRLVHAPLRFMFNIDVGKMPVPQSEQYLRKLQQQYWSTKTFDSDQNDVVKKYMEIIYGDIEMNIDKDEEGFIHFFSRKDFDDDGYPVRIAYRNNTGTLWINFSFLERMVTLFGTSVDEAIEKYFEDKFGIVILRINVEF